MFSQLDIIVEYLRLTIWNIIQILYEGSMAVLA